MADKITLEDFKTEAEAVAALKDCDPKMTTEKARKYIRERLPKESYYQHKAYKRAFPFRLRLEGSGRSVQPPGHTGCMRRH